MDVLASVSRHKKRPKLVIGFAAETEKLLDHARTKLKAKGCDWLVANEVKNGAVFGADENAVTVLTATNAENWPRQSKDAVAAKLVEKISRHFATTKLVKGKSA